MKKVLITGACGFIGSHFTELLVEKGYRVVAFDRYNSDNNWGYLENSIYKKDIEVILGDIRDYDSVKKAMKNCDEVFHLAALIGIPYSYVSPLAYIKTNVEGTYNVLEASKENNASNIIVTSTSEVYGSAQYVPMDEKHPLVGQSPYSASKIAADQLALSYNKSFNLPVKIARPFNTYGPRQSLRAVIPSIISQFKNNNKVIKAGNINAIRDFTYVTDTCEGIFQISKKKLFIGKVTNIGTSEGHSIKSIIYKVQKIFDKKLKIQKELNRVRPTKSEVNTLVCNNSLLLSKTSWKPKIKFNDGLKAYATWLDKDILSRFKSNIYNV
mgnify:CR=1 FL=1